MMKTVGKKVAGRLAAGVAVDRWAVVGLLEQVVADMLVVDKWAVLVVGLLGQLVVGRMIVDRLAVLVVEQLGQLAVGK